MKCSSAWVICLLLTTLWTASRALVIIAPEDLAGMEFNSPRRVFIGPPDWSFDVTGTLVSLNASNVQNKIVLMDSYDNEYEIILDLVKKEALGVLIYGDNSPRDIPGLSNYVVTQFLYDVKLPAVVISVIAIDKMHAWLDEGRNITIRMTSTDVNQWSLMMESGAMVFYSVFMSAFTLTCIGLAAYKLAMFVQVKGCEESIPQTMLILEIVANTIRFFPSVVDPLQSRALLPYAVSQMFFTTSWPFVIVNLLLISFYWHELIKKTSMKINSFLNKLRIPFWCIFAVILALELTASILRSLRYNLRVFLLVMGVCYIIIGLACVVFYIITGVKLTRALRSVAKEIINSNRNRRLRRTSRHIYASAAGVIMWLIAIVIGGLTDTFWLPWGYFGVWFAGFFAITFISLMQILAIHEPRSICATMSFKSTDRSSVRYGTGSTHMLTPVTAPTPREGSVNSDA